MNIVKEFLAIALVTIICTIGVKCDNEGHQNILNSSSILNDSVGIQQFESPSNSGPSLASGMISVQIYTVFEYYGKQIYVYASKTNGPDSNHSKQWQFYYIPVMQPEWPMNSDWVWVVDKEVRMKTILGNDEVQEVARRAIMERTDADANEFSRYWIVAPLLIESLVAYVVKGSNSPVEGVLPYQLIHPNALAITLRFECATHENALLVKKKLLDGYYEAEIAFHFDGFRNGEMNVISITGDQIKSVLSQTTADGGDTNAKFIHRNQATGFVGKYVTNVKQIIYTENANQDFSNMITGLQRQFEALFQQGIQNAAQTKLDVKVYDQIWNSSDLNPDILTSEMNKIFSLNDTFTNTKNDSNKYFNVNRQAASSMSTDASVSVKVGIFGGSASASYSEENSENTAKTTHDIMSEEEIKHLISQQDVEVEWTGEKFEPKSFYVYKLTDVTDRMQVALVAKQLSSERTTGAIIRSVSKPSILQRLTTFEYDGKQIDVYAADTNLNTKPQLWQFYYVPVFKTVHPYDSDWISIVDKEIRITFILGDRSIENVARTAINQKFDETVVKNYSKFWTISFLKMDSLVAYVIKDTNTPVINIQPYQFIHPNTLSITFRFKCTTHVTAVLVKEHLLSGFYEIAIALHFNRFNDVKYNTMSIRSDQLQTISEITKAVSGGNVNLVEYIHQSQIAKFIKKYLENAQKAIYFEDPEKTEITLIKEVLIEQAQHIFQQSIGNLSVTNLSISQLHRMWSSVDIDISQLTTDMNKVYTFNCTITNVYNNSYNYYTVNHAEISRLSKRSSTTISSNIAQFVSENYFQTKYVVSELEIYQAMLLAGLNIKWRNRYFEINFLNVYRVSDIENFVQAALIARQLRTEKPKGAIILTVSALNMNPPITSTPALFTGEIRLYTSNTIRPPFNWLLCNGSAVSRVQYNRLFAAIGTAYGSGDNHTTFNLPDLRGRVPLGRDQNKSRSDHSTKLGETGGQSMHTLTVNHLPSHCHDFGNLTVAAAGSHSHTIYDPGHSHTTSIREDGAGSENGYYFKASNGRHKFYSDRVRIQSQQTGVYANSVGHHTHPLTGATATTGTGQQYSILNPFQTFDYYIYAGF